MRFQVRSQNRETCICPHGGREVDFCPPTLSVPGQVVPQGNENSQGLLASAPVGEAVQVREASLPKSFADTEEKRQSESPHHCGWSPGWNSLTFAITLLFRSFSAPLTFSHHFCWARLLAC